MRIKYTFDDQDRLVETRRIDKTEFAELKRKMLKSYLAEFKREEYDGMVSHSRLAYGYCLQFCDKLGIYTDDIHEEYTQILLRKEVNFIKHYMRVPIEDGSSNLL